MTPPRYLPDLGDRPLSGLTARRRQLGLPVGNEHMPIPVWRTTFCGGPAETRPHRLIATPQQWAVYAHRQAIGIVKVQHTYETRLQEDLWERFVYDRVDVGVGWAVYRLVDHA